MPGKFHGLKRLAVRSLWGPKESDVTEHTYARPFTHWVSTILACHMIWGDQPSPWGKSRGMDLGSPRGGGVHQRAARGGPGLVPKRRKGTCQVHRILRSRALNMGGGGRPTSSAAAMQGLGQQEWGSLGRDPWTTPSPEDTSSTGRTTCERCHHTPDGPYYTILCATCNQKMSRS